MWPSLPASDAVLRVSVSCCPLKAMLSSEGWLQYVCMLTVEPFLPCCCSWMPARSIRVYSMAHCRTHVYVTTVYRIQVRSLKYLQGLIAGTIHQQPDKVELDYLALQDSNCNRSLASPSHMCKAQRHSQRGWYRCTPAPVHKGAGSKLAVCNFGDKIQGVASCSIIECTLIYSSQDCQRKSAKTRMCLSSHW